MHTFEEVQILEQVGLETCIPHLDRHESVFFQGYENEQFEEMFQEL